MTMRTWGAAFLALGLLGSLAAPAHGAVLDSFSAPAGVSVFNTIRGGTNPNTALTTDASILGLNRLMTGRVGTIFPGPVDGSNLSVVYGAGVLNFNSSGPTGASLEIAYGLAAGGAALGDLNALGSFFAIDFQFLQTNLANTPMTVEITAVTTTGTRTFTTTIPVSASPFTLTAPYGSFGGTGSFSSVNSLSFLFNKTLLTDVDFNFVPGSGVRIQEIPEPATLLLFGGVAAAGWLVARRRSSRQPAA